MSKACKARCDVDVLTRRQQGVQERTGVVSVESRQSVQSCWHAIAEIVLKMQGNQFSLSSEEMFGDVKTEE